MSSSSPFGDPNMFSEWMKMFTSAGPIHTELARHTALAVASGGQTEANVEPVERIRLEELARVADLHIADATGMDTSVTGRGVSIRPVTRGDWAHETLQAWLPLLESVAGSLSGAPPAPGATGVGPGPGPDRSSPGSLPTGPGPDPEFDWGSGLAGLLGQAAQAVGPALIGMQFGSAVGNLARTSLGQYELAIPRPVSDEVMLVAQNISSFARDWSLPPDDVGLWVCLHEIAHHCLLSRPPVRDRLVELVGGYAAGFVSDRASIEERLAGFDPTNPGSMETTLSDPNLLLGELLTPAQVQLGAQLQALTAAIEGWVDHITDKVGRRLITSYGSLREALSRQRVSGGEGARFAECVFGLKLTQAHYDRGASFVAGVVERAGEEALMDLWSRARNLPTPAEVDAPGLWLERIAIPDS
ncbi:MAG: zinc-dependent metalloprotease [Acidimicrobiales bacterium]